MKHKQRVYKIQDGRKVWYWRNWQGDLFLDVAGLPVPESFWDVPPHIDPETCKPYEESHARSWGLTTEEVALLFDCSQSSARQFLHAHRIPFIAVKRNPMPLIYYWKRTRVEKLLNKRDMIAPTIENPEGFYTVDEFMAVYKISRITVQRCCNKGLPRIWGRVKMISKRSPRPHIRIVSLYPKTEADAWMKSRREKGKL